MDYTKCSEFLQLLQDGDDLERKRNNGITTISHLIAPFMSKWDTICGLIPGQFKSGILSYFRSCQYTEKIVKENNEIFDLKFQTLDKEQLQVKAMVRRSLDQVHNLKVSHGNKLKEIEKKMLKSEQENQELKSLVYSLLDQVDDFKENKQFFLERVQELENDQNELKEHNKSLSSRVFELESLLEKKEVPNLIDI